MVIVNHIRMAMPYRSMTMRMAVRFSSFPTLVIMLVMGVVGVFMFMIFLRVGVQQDRFILLRPQPGSQGCKHQDTRSESQRCSFHAEVGPEQSGHQIENQPASMG